MAHGSQKTAERAQVVRAGQLVDATPEVLAELAESAMLLSQGRPRAIEMKRQAIVIDERDLERSRRDPRVRAFHKHADELLAELEAEGADYC